MHVHNYLKLVFNSEDQIKRAFKKVADHHKDEPDIYSICHMLASWSEKHITLIEPLMKKYSKHAGSNKEPERLNQTLFSEPRKGALALLRDLHDLWLLTKEIEICWKVLLQAAKALRDTDLVSLCENLSQDTKRQSDWLQTRIKQAAPQILIVAE